MKLLLKYKLANERAKKAFKYRKITALIAGWIIELLQRDFTPEQVADPLLIEKRYRSIMKQFTVSSTKIRLMAVCFINVCHERLSATESVMGAMIGEGKSLIGLVLMNAALFVIGKAALYLENV